MYSKLRSTGFTLIELMVTVAVAVVLIAVAIPSFKNLIARNELVTVTNAWVGAVNLARAEAIKLNQAVVICGESGAPTSGAGSDCDAALAGQVRYQPVGGGSAEALNASLSDSVSSSLKIVSSSTVRFRSDGMGYRGDSVTTPYNTAGGDPAVVVLCTSALADNNARRIELITGSRVQVVSETRKTCP